MTELVGLTLGILAGLLTPFAYARWGDFVKGEGDELYAGMLGLIAGVVVAASVICWRGALWFYGISAGCVLFFVGLWALGKVMGAIAGRGRD